MLPVNSKHFICLKYFSEQQAAAIVQPKGHTYNIVFCSHLRPRSHYGRNDSDGDAFQSVHLWWLGPSHLYCPEWIVELPSAQQQSMTYVIGTTVVSCFRWCSPTLHKQMCINSILHELVQIMQGIFRSHC